MTNNEIIVSYQRYAGISELSDADRSLCEQAVEAMETSHSPYSKFRVGTAIQLSGDQVVLGSNQENVAYPSGLCAERVALFAIGAMKGAPTIKSMAITAQTEHFKIHHPITSCGACLQVMIEFEKRQTTPIEVLFYCLDGEILKVSGIKNLMPFGFVEDRLANG